VTDMDRLVVDGWGKHIGIENSQIVVKARKEGGGYSVIHRCPPSNLRQLIISGKGSISTSAIESLASNGTDIILIDWRGNVKARVSPPIMRTVNTRRKQYLAYHQTTGAYLAREFVHCKMRNQIAVLGTLAKTRKDTHPEISKALKNARNTISISLERIKDTRCESCDQIRSHLLGMEGNAAASYWAVIQDMIGDEFEFQGRSGRYASDPLNAMLNYGYAVLESEAWRAIHYAGLDPYGGFLHVDRPGRPSMVLDLMEEFRQQVIDKTIFTFFSRNQVKPRQFTVEDGVCVMDDKPRKLLLSTLLSKMEEHTRYKNKKMRWTDLVLTQARKIGKFLRRETKTYKGFWSRW